MKQFGFGKDCVVRIHKIPNLDFVNTLLAPARIRQRRSSVATERNIGTAENIPLANSVDVSYTGSEDMEIDDSVPVHVHVDDNDRRNRNLNLFNIIPSSLQDMSEFYNYHRSKQLQLSKTSTQLNRTCATVLHTIPQENQETLFE